MKTNTSSLTCWLTRIVGLFIALALPFSGLAHEKWFVEKIPAGMTKPELFSTWSAFSLVLLVLVGFSFVVVLFLHLGTGKNPKMVALLSTINPYRVWNAPLLRSLTGIVLFMATFWRFLFAPDLHTMGIPYESIFLSLQLLIGLALVVGVFPRFVGGMGLLLYIGAFFIYPFISVISYISLAGIFTYLLIKGDPTLPRVGTAFAFEKIKEFLKRLEPHASSILRIGMGLALILGGGYYKIYEPGYALEFVRIHYVNFLPDIGLNFVTNEMFVMMVGVAEVFMGAMLVVGVLPRLVGLATAVMLTITLKAFGLSELVGHLPLYAICFALVTEGNGERWKW